MTFSLTKAEQHNLFTDKRRAERKFFEKAARRITSSLEHSSFTNKPKAKRQLFTKAARQKQSSITSLPTNAERSVSSSKKTERCVTSSLEHSSFTHKPKAEQLFLTKAARSMTSSLTKAEQHNFFTVSAEHDFFTHKSRAA